MVARKLGWRPLENMKVLLVDKHPMVRAHLRQLLAAFPRIEISEAADVHEGLALARNRRPTLILVDLEVSDLGGVKLLRSIHIENPDARVVMLSGRAEPILAARAMCAGAAGYVRKNRVVPRTAANRAACC
jgi:two-component system, NarL family, invasion response regulator UvrY